MAASLCFGRATSNIFKRAVKACITSPVHCSQRFLLSQAYGCNEVWKKRLEDPLLSQVPLTDFAIQLRDQHEKQKIISAVDMEILANQLHEMDIDEAEFMEDLMLRFRKSPDATPVRDSIVYVIIRNYITIGAAERLIPLLNDRSTTGIFPNVIASSLLLDHFIEEKDFANAAQVAYELMLQETFDHPTSRLLSLFAVVHHLESVSLDDIAPEEIVDPTGEEDWVAVKYIRYPNYDDHFDIKSEQYLLGKTLFYLGKHEGQNTLGNSLQVIGLALYQKFDQCFQLLNDIAASTDQCLTSECLKYVEESLEKVQLRDPNKAEKETGLLTIDDEIYKLLPTQEQKAGFQDQLGELRPKLQQTGKIGDEELSSLVDALVMSELPQFEAADIETQTRWLEEWQTDRHALLQEQLYQLEKKQKVVEIEERLKELQEKEEMIRFFELNDKIRMIQPKKIYVEKKPEEIDEETLRARRIKRRKFRHNI